MKNQSDIAITDIYPDRFKPRRAIGLTRQEDFLFRKHSARLPCPSCNTGHTLNELTVNHPEFVEGGGHQFFQIFVCPVTKEELTHGITMFGGEDFLNKTGNIYQSK